MADKSPTSNMSEVRARLNKMAELGEDGSSVRTIKEDIRRIVREELDKLGLEPGEADYEGYETYTCSICTSQLPNDDESHPIPHKSVVDCFKAFLRRVRV